MISFVYKWIDKGLGKYYIGAHKGTIDDGYICSSKLMLEQYRKRPFDFFREILSYHNSFPEALTEEARLQLLVNAAKNPDYYNQHNGNGKYYLKAHTEETKKRFSEMRIGKDLSRQRGRPKSEAHRNAFKGPRPNFNQTGHKNNNAKTITTSFGIFGSLRDCSNELNMKYDAVMWRLNSSNYPEWRRI